MNGKIREVITDQAVAGDGVIERQGQRQQRSELSDPIQRSHRSRIQEVNPDRPHTMDTGVIDDAVEVVEMKPVAEGVGKGGQDGGGQRRQVQAEGPTPRARRV